MTTRENKDFSSDLTPFLGTRSAARAFPVLALPRVLGRIPLLFAHVWVRGADVEWVGCVPSAFPRLLVLPLGIRDGRVERGFVLPRALVVRPALAVFGRFRVDAVFVLRVFARVLRVCGD